MDETNADILMMFILDDGSTLPGESTLQKAPKDEFMTDFRCVSSYDDYSNFFEVTGFNLGLQVESSDKGAQNTSKTAQGHPVAVRHAGATQHGAAGAAAGTKTSNDEWDRWRSATDDELRKLKYPVKVGTISFDRIIDASSPVFFANCANQVKFKSATLVKRVSVGGGKPGAPNSAAPQEEGVGGQSVGFLRIEFTGVMVKSLSWNDGDMVTENVTMECDNIKIRYKKQKYAGELEPETSAVWDRELNDQKQGKDK